LQKYRFFAGAGKPILCFHQIEEASAMTAFWKNLQALALGQLFNGGYFGGRTAALPPRDAQPTPAAPETGTNERNQRLPNARVAVCQ
jgi:hypothetical protein